MSLTKEQATIVAKYLVAGWEAKPYTQKMGETVTLRRGDRIVAIKPDGQTEEVTV